MSENLFSDFKKFSAEEWREKILIDLKGKPFENLVKENFEGIEVKPDFTQEDIQSNEGIPGKAPFSRGVKTENNSWEIAQLFEKESSKELNTALLEALNRGVTAIRLGKESQADLNTTLTNVLPQYISTYFEHHDNLEEAFTEFYNIVKNSGAEPTAVKGAFLNDPLGSWLITGKWNETEKTDLKKAIRLTESIDSALPSFRSFHVNGQYFHNAGGTATQEVAFALAQAHEYLVLMLENGWSIDDASAKIQLTLAAGTNYFMEIAKFRAVRLLWSKIVAEYKPKHECSHALFVSGESSKWHSTIYDPYNNMLRGTAEAMAASIGGANCITILPFDDSYAESNEFSERISRNIQLVLQEESYLDKIIDPSAGSYYIEYLTDQLALKAWNMFQEVEAMGGFIAAARKSFIQDEIGKIAKQKVELVNEGKLVVLGVNTYPNKEELMQDKVDMAKMSIEKKKFYGTKLLGDLKEEHTIFKSEERTYFKSEETVFEQPTHFESDRKSFTGNLLHHDKQTREDSEETIEILPQFRAAEELENIRLTNEFQS